jgi:hypothetical protein
LMDIPLDIPLDIFLECFLEERLLFLFIITIYYLLIFLFLLNSWIIM